MQIDHEFVGIKIAELDDAVNNLTSKKDELEETRNNIELKNDELERTLRAK